MQRTRRFRPPWGNIFNSWGHSMGSTWDWLQQLFVWKLWRTRKVVRRYPQRSGQKDFKIRRSEASYIMLHLYTSKNHMKFGKVYTIPFWDILSVYTGSKIDCWSYPHTAYHLHFCLPSWAQVFRHSGAIRVLVAALGSDSPDGTSDTLGSLSRVQGRGKGGAGQCDNLGCSSSYKML